MNDDTRFRFREVCESRRLAEAVLCLAFTRAHPAYARWLDHYNTLNRAEREAAGEVAPDGYATGFSRRRYRA